MGNGASAQNVERRKEADAGEELGAGQGLETAGDEADQILWLEKRRTLTQMSGVQVATGSWFVQLTFRIDMER